MNAREPLQQIRQPRQVGREEVEMRKYDIQTRMAVEHALYFRIKLLLSLHNSHHIPSPAPSPKAA